MAKPWLDWAGVILALVMLLCGVGLLVTEDVRAASSDQPAEPGQPIVIRWSTESEVDTAGYNIYRAEDQSGPWVRINPRLIPGSPDPLRGGNYVFTDTAVIAGTTYWYELEEVEQDGSTLRLERTQAVAQPLATGPLAGLPCGSSLLPIAAGAMVLAGRVRLRGHRHRAGHVLHGVPPLQ